MTFANPFFLYLLIPLFIICLLGAFLKIKFTAKIKYPLAKQIDHNVSAFFILANWLPYLLIVLALILLIIALARPQKQGQTTIPPTKGIDIMLTIDTSGSMRALDFSPNRMEAAKQTALDFMEKRSSDRIGVVVFADNAMLQCPLTLDYFAIEEYIKLIHIGMLKTPGGTAIGDAIAVSTLHLKDSPTKSKIIVLVTDGESNTGTLDPVSAAKAANGYGIKIYTIAISGEGMVSQLVRTAFGMQNVNTKADPLGEGLLKEIADLTGGQFFRARNNFELSNIYKTIDQLEKTEFDKRFQVSYEDAYQPLLVMALMLLICAFILQKFVFIEVP
ncbi:MAG: VWA domain-containing protein [Elusimicrobiaceae bacterium]|nr:VWA domain-containing protein [Elusimicrobiaceae bacterium]